MLLVSSEDLKITNDGMEPNDLINVDMVSLVANVEGVTYLLLGASELTSDLTPLEIRDVIHSERARQHVSTSPVARVEPLVVSSDNSAGQLKPQTLSEAVGHGRSGPSL